MDYDEDDYNEEEDGKLVRLKQRTLKKLKEMYDETYQLYIGRDFYTDGRLIHMYEFDPDIEIAKVSDLIFEKEIYDDRIEVRPYMHHEVDPEEAWRWLCFGDLFEEIDDLMSEYFEEHEDVDIDDVSADDLVKYFEITNM